MDGIRSLLYCDRHVCISRRVSEKSAELRLWPSIGERFTDGVFQIHSNHPEASPWAPAVLNREYIVALWLKSIPKEYVSSCACIFVDLNKNVTEDLSMCHHSPPLPSLLFLFLVT